MSSDPAETETETENANKANSEASETKHAHLLGTMILHRLLYIVYCILSIVYYLLYIQYCIICFCSALLVFSGSAVGRKRPQMTAAAVPLCRVVCVVCREIFTTTCANSCSNPLSAGNF